MFPTGILFILKKSSPRAKCSEYVTALPFVVANIYVDVYTIVDVDVDPLILKLHEPIADVDVDVDVNVDADL